MILQLLKSGTDTVDDIAAKFPPKRATKSSGAFLCELILMIDTLFTCNPLEPRKWIDLLSALSLSCPLSTSLIFSATTCQKHTLTNNKSHVWFTQRLHFTFFYLNDTSRTYRNICSSLRTRPRFLSHTHPWWFCHIFWQARRLGEDKQASKQQGTQGSAGEQVNSLQITSSFGNGNISFHQSLTTSFLFLLHTGIKEVLRVLKEAIMFSVGSNSCSKQNCILILTNV